MTRNRDNLHLVRCKTSYGSRSVKYKGSNLWNQLPNDIKVIASLNSSKSKLKSILGLDNIAMEAFIYGGCLLYF